jgi:hypothetical protein
MRKLTQYLTLLIIFTISSCSQKPDSATMEMAEFDIEASPTEQKAEEIIERKLIKEGQIEFEVDDLTTIRKTIFEVVKKYNGYVSSDQEFNTPGRKSNTLIIRVPSDNFDRLLQDATQGIERFDNKEITVKDVTEEFLDIQARLKTKKELENRFLDILKQAKSVTEILEIEKEIGQLRSEIESIEGRLKYLQNRVSFSTLTITFYESISTQTKFGQEFKNGFSNGWNNLVWFFVLLTNIWPFVLIGILMLFGIRVYRKKKN